jgi:hypothetical protein
VLCCGGFTDMVHRAHMVLLPMAVLALLLYAEARHRSLLQPGSGSTVHCIPHQTHVISSPCRDLQVAVDGACCVGWLLPGGHPP